MKHVYSYAGAYGRGLYTGTAEEAAIDLKDCWYIKRIL